MGQVACQPRAQEECEGHIQKGGRAFGRPPWFINSVLSRACPGETCAIGVAGVLAWPVSIVGATGQRGGR